MTSSIAGTVTNGVVVPNFLLPEGTRVEIQLQTARAEVSSNMVRLAPGELRRLPQAERQAILTVAAAIAEEDYRDDKELTGFNAFNS